MAASNRDLRDLENSLPYGGYEYIEMVFNATADVDTEVPYATLSPERPDDVDFQVVGVSFSSAPAAAPVVYKDTSATRRPWQRGYIVLRANVASLRATLLLTTRRH